MQGTAPFNGNTIRMEYSNKNVKVIGFTTVAAIMGIGFALAMGASADVGMQRNGASSLVRQNCTSERHAEMEEAIANRDYDAWVGLMEGKGRVTQVVTRENFETFIQMREARLTGDTEKADELRESLGLGVHPRDGVGHMKGYGRGEGRGRGMH